MLGLVSFFPSIIPKPIFLIDFFPKEVTPLDTGHTCGKTIKIAIATATAAIITVTIIAFIVNVILKCTKGKPVT